MGNFFVQYKFHFQQCIVYFNKAFCWYMEPSDFLYKLLVARVSNRYAVNHLCTFTYCDLRVNIYRRCIAVMMCIFLLLLLLMAYSCWSLPCPPHHSLASNPPVSMGDPTPQPKPSLSLPSSLPSPLPLHHWSPVLPNSCLLPCSQLLQLCLCIKSLPFSNIKFFSFKYKFLTVLTQQVKLYDWRLNKCVILICSCHIMTN